MAYLCRISEDQNKMKRSLVISTESTKRRVKIKYNISIGLWMIEKWNIIKNNKIAVTGVSCYELISTNVNQE